jgi:hypothetical protein
MKTDTLGYESSIKGEYNSMIAFLSFMTGLFGFLNILVGYITLPFSAGFYAALLYFEKKSKIFSIMIPAVIFVINILINGIFSLEAIAYVIIGLILYLCFLKKNSKSDTVLYITLTTFVLVILSFIFLGAKETGTVKPEMIARFYSGVYFTLKDYFVDTISSITVKDDKGLLYFAINRAEAEEYFNYAITMLIPIFSILSMILSGITIRIFTGGIRKYSTDEYVDNWIFHLSTPTAVIYVIASIVRCFNSPMLLSYTVDAVTMILLIPFFYIGITILYNLLSGSKGRFFAVAVIVVAFLLSASFAITVLSYIGVYFNSLINKTGIGKRSV